MSESCFSIAEVCGHLCPKHRRNDGACRPRCQGSWREQNPRGGRVPNDKTVQQSAPPGARVGLGLGDRKGLGLAPNLGARENLLSLTFFICPDNVIDRSLIKAMRDDLDSVVGVVACWCLTRSQKANYLGTARTAMLQSPVRPGGSLVRLPP